MAMKEVSYVRSHGSKAQLVTVGIALSDEKYTISEGTYRRIGCPLSGDYLDEDDMRAIAREDGERRALARALKILSYADNSEKRLYTKLITAGFEPTYAKFATEECVRLGYLCEKSQLERFTVRLAEELWGPKKIMARLISRGYARDDIRQAIERLTDSGVIDFQQSRSKLIEKKLGDNFTAEDKHKLFKKYGY